MELKNIEKKTCCKKQQNEEVKTNNVGTFNERAIRWVKDLSRTTFRVACATVIGINTTAAFQPGNESTERALNLFFTTAFYSGAYLLEKYVGDRKIANVTDNHDGKESAQSWYNRVKFPAFVLNFFTTNAANKLLGVVAGILLLKDFYLLFGSMLISVFSFAFWTSRGVTPCVNTGFTTPCKCSH
ncbi:MAG: hypothetical protein COZ46_06510 [Verrucomicrobia bacterium CG_4_10_14_3_um_filter_43_23]|nr:MAG: hypothetical protein AUJ82_00275 [Verrucomicrobia bacterium CG1_02_43_26]PIP59289.1 MAG: hypothetical protein COX01_04660 [Verrucomicrobia bacterium CG22_combo_CG10-13_8_21_14_all_43_17]PIX57945.1 MAG: hypothetical protein COZ46_06510 [Verrucomicrobia bacterium CG_4_10_14_3_um_filter_43_23]PIY61748.1 MAG: hypothetical protein COY94_04015 [Verrucomicrobia bacterium CG_4_10_14_0_8_um_filter_43_34]PJA43452.1 MAG: hypothetical protein CO175_08105 [Verrucomicrobia bacterium CG_4_9_14_3_um_fi